MPKAKDTGTKYEEHPVSSGPYKVVTNENDGERLVLERNEHWSAATDEERKAYPDKIDVRSGLDSAVINQRLSASQGVDAAAVTTDTNLGPAELAKVPVTRSSPPASAPATSATRTTSPSTRR